MKKDLSHIRALISEYAHSELPSEKAAIVKAHLDACPSCMAEYESVKALLAAVAASKQDAIQDSSAIRQRMKAAVAEPVVCQSYGFRRWAWGMAAAAVFAVVSVLSGLAIHSVNLKSEQALVDRELVQSFVQDNQDAVYVFAYSPNSQTEYSLFEEFYDYLVDENGVEDAKVLKSNFKYLVQNIDQLI